MLSSLAMTCFLLLASLVILRDLVMTEARFIPSFGRRKTRKLRTHSQKALDEILPRLRLSLDQKGRALPQDEVWLEIGFGGGEHFLEQLRQNPSISMIGCEPYTNGVAKLLMHLSPGDYGRVFLWTEDVRYLLGSIPPSYFSCVFILFPDPWSKNRHSQRRLISKEFMEQLWPTLQEGAFLYVASDNPSYIAHIWDALHDFPGLILCEGPSSADPHTWASRPQDWPATRYEQKALKQGKKCAYMRFQKREMAN